MQKIFKENMQVYQTEYNLVKGFEENSLSDLIQEDYIIGEMNPELDKELDKMFENLF